MTLGTDPFALPTSAIPRRFVGFDACNLGAVAVTEAGEIVCFGGVPHCGDLSGQLLAAPVCGVKLNGTGRGYWVLLEDGASCTFPDVEPDLRHPPRLEMMRPHREWFER